MITTNDGDDDGSCGDDGGNDADADDASGRCTYSIVLPSTHFPRD